MNEQKKQTNNSTPKKYPTKRSTSGFDANMEYSYRKIPVSKAIVNNMIEELSTWVESNPTSYAASDFYHKRGMTKRAYYRLLQSNPDLKETHELVMEKLGERLWQRSIEKKLDWNAVKIRMHRYNSDFQEDFQIQAKLAADARAQVESEDGSKGDSKTQYVVIRDPVYVEHSPKKVEYTM